MFIASDHAGFQLKQAFVNEFCGELEWQDLGPKTSDSVDYPQYAEQLCREILSSNLDRYIPCGLLICGSGVGVSMAANRFSGIRAVLAGDTEVAKLSRLHNASNVLCLGERLLEKSKAFEIFKVWKETEFEGGRHKRRVDLMDSFSSKS